MLTEEHLGRNLAASSPELERILTHSAMETPAQFTVAQIRCETVWVPMRDGVRLATDLYLPPELSAPAIAMRTPYGRAIDAFVGAFLSFARRGYVVISQDCRGTGDSEPDGSIAAVCTSRRTVSIWSNGSANKTGSAAF